MKDDTTRAEVREALLKYLDTDTIWSVLPISLDILLNGRLVSSTIIPNH
jgi:hypothetical protein